MLLGFQSLSAINDKLEWKRLDTNNIKKDLRRKGNNSSSQEETKYIQLYIIFGRQDRSPVSAQWILSLYAKLIYFCNAFLWPAETPCLSELSTNSLQKLELSHDSITQKKYSPLSASPFLDLYAEKNLLKTSHELYSKSPFTNLISSIALNVRAIVLNLSPQGKSSFLCHSIQSMEF